MASFQPSWPNSQPDPEPTWDPTTANTGPMAAVGYPPYLPKPLAMPRSPRWLGQKIVNAVWAAVVSKLFLLAYVVVLTAAVSHVNSAGWHRVFIASVGVVLGVQIATSMVVAIIANPFSLLQPEHPYARTGLRKVLGDIFAPEWLEPMLWNVRILRWHLIPTPESYRREEGVLWYQWVFSLPALIIAGIPGYVAAIVVNFVGTWVGRLMGAHLPFDYSTWPAFARPEIYVATHARELVLMGIFSTLFYSRILFRVYAMAMLRGFTTQMAALFLMAGATGNVKLRQALSRVNEKSRLVPAAHRAAFIQEIPATPTDPRPMIKWNVLAFMGVVIMFVLVAAPIGNAFASRLG